MIVDNKILNVAYFSLITLATSAVVLINPFFGSIIFIAFGVIVLLSNKYLSSISKLLVASLYIAVAVLVIHSSTTYIGIYWERDDFEDEEVFLRSAVLKFTTGVSTSIPEKEFGKVRELASLADSAWWINKWENIIGVQRKELYELLLESDVARDYKIIFKEKIGEKNNILAVVYKELPDGYKIDKNQLSFLGVYYTPKLHAYINNMYNKASPADAEKRRD